MFDGNFRSQREVNLGGGNNRRRRGRASQQQSNKRNSSSGSNNKQDLLKNAEMLRKQRQEQQRKEKSARLIQRVARGHQRRLQVLEDFIDDTDNVTAVSMCLSLRRFANNNKSKNNANSDYNNKSEKQLVLEYSEHLPGADVKISSSSSLWFSHRRLVQATFRTLTPEDTDEMERQGLLSILQTYLPTLSMTVPLFLDLTVCFQKWWTIQTMTHPITTALCRWSMEAATSMNTNSNTTSTSTTTTSTTNLSKALLASIFLGAPCHKISDNNAVYTTWVLPLAEILQKSETTSLLSNDSSNNNNNSDDQKALIQAVLKNLQGGKERKVLTNILDLPSQPDPRPVMQLVRHVLLYNTTTSNTTSISPSNTNTSSDLAVMAALLARGDNLDSAQASSGWGDDEEDDENRMDEDDDSDHEDEDPQQQQQNNKSNNNDVPKKARSNQRHTRKDLLTSLKLDKVYQDQIKQRKQDLLAGTVKAETNDLAKKIVNAPWLKWGLQILDPENNINNGSGNSASARSFVETLACLLQATTSLRPTAKLNVLSPVAFSKPFMQKLWDYSKSTGSRLALSVFCDLFAHYLIALSDVNFLQHHTTVSDNTINSNGTVKGVMAEDVIVEVRALLYELYWSKPVMASEIVAQCERGRAFLSATKVWNSLYERWNRLLRRPFCDESAWWFPHLASKEGDGDVMPNSQQQQDDDDNNDDDDDDSMDIDEDDEDPNAGLSAAEVETDALADTFRDPKMARILTCIPQALPFDRRVKLFHSLLKADKRKALNAAISNRAMDRMRNRDPEELFFGNIREQVQIRRAHLYGDSMNQLNSMGPRLKHQVQVSFINQHGAEEAGIDGGGVFKEFLDDLIKDGFAVKDDTTSNNAAGAPPLFAVTPLQTLAVNFDLQEGNMLAHYEFVGRVLGKAVYESILVEPQFCLPFLNQLLAKPNTMEDLKNYDEEYYKNLTKLRQLSKAEIDSLELTFELTISSGSTTPNSSTKNTAPRTVELIPGGRSIAVTEKNVFQYIHLVAHQLLNVQGARQTKSFLRGFRDLIPASWVRLFSANELQKLISGDDSVRGIDVPSLKRSMHYLGGYHISQPYIQDFWDILETEFTPEQQRLFLKFMTSCSRQPLLGFASLDPVPSIQQIRLSEDELSPKNSKLPTSQTCMNLLKLPNYRDRQLLKEKLLAAIESGAGFELT